MAVIDKTGEAHLGGRVIFKAGGGTLGTPSSAIVKTGTGVMPLVGSAVDAVTFNKTAAGVYNPFVWMDDGREPASLVLTASGAVVRGTGSRTGSGILAFAASGTKLLNGVKTGAGVLAFAASGTKEFYAPVTYVKAGQGTLTLVVGTPRTFNTSDGRRSLRWIGRRSRRRDRW